jgi:penicillin-binding protein 1C
VNQERLLQVWQREFPQERFERIFAGRAELQLNAPHFVDRVALLAGARGEVHTTLAPVMQRLSERMLKDFLARNRALGFLNGTVMIVDSRTMEVLAYVGSAGYTDSAIQGYVNGLAALRSPGSVLKPFIYALAIDQGFITTDTLLKDTPLRIANYQPENFERNFLGPLSATEALVRSRNIPAIALTRSLKKPGLHGFLRQAAFLLPRAEEYYGLSLALGTFEVSMEQVLAAYAMLSGGRGVYRPLSWFGPSQEQGVRLLSAESAYLVWRMLRQNPRPNQLFGARTFGRDRPVAWKTGTSFRARDAWAVGIADALVVGVWLGNFDGTPNPNLVGRDAAGPLLFSVIEGLRAELGRQGREPQVPYNLKEVDICPVSGALAGEHCPHRRKGLIVPGVSSLRTCVVHREVLIDVATGQRVCDESYRGVVRREVMEVWDSDLLKLFELAGLSRRTPPPFMQICPAPDAETRGARAPQILSPQEGVVYQLRPHQESERRIELSAVRDGGRSALFWFIDDELVGEGESVFWSGRPGSFTVRVVDDQGQVAVRTVQVQWAPG